MATVIIEKESRVEPCSIQLPLCTEEVIIHFGDARILRSRRCKNNLFFAPFIPSSEVLLLFPNGVKTATGELQPDTLTQITRFLCLVQEASSSNFHISDGIACQRSGCVLIALKCANVEDAITVMDRSQDVARHSDKVWPSNLYVHSMLYESVEKIMQSTWPNPTDLMSIYYYYPLCPLCADRLDKTLTGYPSSSICCCSETGSHCACVETSMCQVCQLFFSALTQKESVGSSDAIARSSAANRCYTCGRVEDPWVCLLCGYIGCSRYQAMHAKEHSLKAGHCFSMNLLTQEVWDYESDAFVHRLVLCLDRHTGSTSRIQYPEREELESMEVAKEPLEKKCISAKFDAHLNTSHTQYAITMKNELDAARVQLERELLLRLAFQESEEMVKKTPPPPPSRRHPSLPFSSSCGYEEDWKKRVDVIAKKWVDATRDLATQQHEDAVAEQEMERLRREEAELQVKQQTLKSELQEALQRRVEDDLKLEEQIIELRTTLREIHANFSAAAAINRRMGAEDGLASFVALGGPAKTTQHPGKGRKR